MLCCVCKEKPATVHLTEIKADKIQKVDLCEACAKAKNVNDPNFALADLLFGLGASQEIDQSASGTELRCPHCGFTQADFKKSGRLGCPECYKTFVEGLEGLLKSMHKGTRHVGKAPEAMRRSRESADRMKLLQKKLTRAVEEEHFEQAAQLRDEIRLLSGQSSEATV